MFIMLFIYIVLTDILFITGHGSRYCPVCGAPAKYHAKYCATCWRFCNSRHPGLPVAERTRAMKEALDRKAGGFRCYYTGMLLDMADPRSPWYLTFDHIVPERPHLVVCARLINEMKRDLTGKEFRLAVPAVSDFLEKGIPVDPGLIRFERWFRSYRMPLWAALRRTPPSPKGCAVCEMKRHRYSLYCDTCRGFIFHKKEHQARVAAMKEAWDPVRQGFICRYSGVLLEIKNWHSPWYMTFDHRFPGKKGNMAVCAAWINGMKTCLTDEQFRSIMKELADHFRDGTPFYGKVLNERGVKINWRLGAKRRL